MEVSALKYSAGMGLHGRSALLRLQSDERLIAYLRKGNTAAFEVLVGRYETRLLAFCRHLLGSREDAEDVLQEVMAAAFNAIVADERPIHVRPWLYRIARNRSLNHLRRVRAIATDTIDSHFSDHGASTADKVHEREEFRVLVGDIHELPETQKTALVLREMDALSYEQIAEAMETTVPSVKSLLVRARVSLAEAAEARLLSCDEVRIELGELAEGLRRRPSPLVRRHLRSCDRCSVFRAQLKHTNKALAAMLPIGPLVIFKQLALFHLGHSAGAGAGSAGSGAVGAASGAGAAGAGAGLAASGGVLAGSGGVASGGFLSAGLGAIAGKAAASLAAAAIVTAGAVEADHGPATHHTHRTTVAAVVPAAPGAQAAAPTSVTPVASHAERRSTEAVTAPHRAPAKSTKSTATNAKTPGAGAGATAGKPTASIDTPINTKAKPAGRSQTQTDPTVLPPSASTPLSTGTTTPGTATSAPAATPTPTPTPTTGTPTTPTTTAPTTTTPTTTTPAPTTTTPTTSTPAPTTSTPTPPPPPPGSGSAGSGASGPPPAIVINLPGSSAP